MVVILKKINIDALKDLIEDLDNDYIKWYGQYSGRGSMEGQAITIDDAGDLLRLGAVLQDYPEYDALIDGFCQMDSLGSRTVCLWHHTLFDK